MAEKDCELCGSHFSYYPNPNFPDKRKYCDSCAATKKAEYEASKKTLQKPLAFAPKPSMPSESHHDVIINRTEKPHSYEFGPANARHKIYYGDVEELRLHIEVLRELGLVSIPVEKIE